jgi:sugar fermentation stimulation protein A
LNTGIPLYRLGDCLPAVFLSRPNRFVIRAEIDGKEALCHLHDSGRLGELLFPGNRITVRKAENGERRKTLYDVLSAVADDGEEILINSSLHRVLSETLLRNPEISPFGEIHSLRAEVKSGDSRVDFLLEKSRGVCLENIWVEVKGVSLSLGKTAMFPDAPSERAVRHLHNLMRLRQEGDRAAVLLLILRDALSFRPRFETDPAFHEAFYEAMASGVEFFPVQLSLERGVVYFREKRISIITKRGITAPCQYEMKNEKRKTFMKK